MHPKEQSNESNNQDVWSSIRNLRKKMKTSRNETELNSMLQKSQNSTKFSSNLSMISNRELSISNLSHKEERKANETNEIVNNNFLENFESNDPHSSNEIKLELNNLKKENLFLFEENKRLENIINTLKKENGQNLSNLQRYHNFEIEEKEKYFKEEIENLRKEYERELTLKDEELEIMSSLLTNTTEDRYKSLNLEKKKNRNYEEMINMLKSEFQNEIINLKSNNEKKIQQYIREKLKLEKTIEEMRSEINSLKYLEIYSHLISNKENHMSDNHPHINKNDKNINNLLMKINKCIHNNEFSDTDPNLMSQTEFATRLLNNNNLMGTLSELANDTMSKLVVAEEFPDENYFENSKEMEKNEEDVSLGEEKLFWMNYSIKNMNDKIKLFHK